MNEKIIYTIGHSTHDIEKFIAMLLSFNVTMLADIRGLPGSRKYPQFNKEQLETSLKNHGIKYIHIKELGGRRKIKKNSKNTRCHNASFRSYADYMETDSFEKGIAELQKLAMENYVAYMCAEAAWWRCHRSMASDYLKAKGWRVLHIMAIGKAEEHTYTSPAIIIGESVVYYDEAKCYG